MQLTNDADYDKVRIPTEHELRVARLMNVPKRGFCVSYDIEKLNAESYQYLYDPDEFKPPDVL